MGRTKGSKNGIRKVPLKKFRIQEPKQETTTENDFIVNSAMMTTEIIEPTLPIFDSNVLKAFRNKRYGKCIELIQRILNNNTDENKDHYKILLAGALTMLGKEIDKAHEILDEVLKFAPMNSSALYAKGVAFYFQHEIDQSVKMFDKAIESNSGTEMEKARDMKMRIDLERRKAVIMVEKMEENLPELSMEIDEDVEMVEIGKENSEKIAEIIGVSSAQIPEVLHEKNDENVREEIETVLSLKSSENLEENEEKLKPVNSATISSSCEPIPDIPESLPKSFKPKTAEEFYRKGMELYTSGSLKKSLRMFEKSMQIDPTFTKSDEMGTKAQEYLELVDTATMNMNLKNYGAVVEILNEALDVDATNLYINRPFYFQRGLALFHLGKNEESMRDYAEFDRINKILSED